MAVLVWFEDIFRINYLGYVSDLLGGLPFAVELSCFDFHHFHVHIFDCGDVLCGFVVCFMGFVLDRLFPWGRQRLLLRCLFLLRGVGIA